MMNNNQLRGVSYLLMADDLRPSKVPTSVIDDLRAREIGDGIVFVFMSTECYDVTHVVQGLIKKSRSRGTI